MPLPLAPLIPLAVRLGPARDRPLPAEREVVPPVARVIPAAGRHRPHGGRIAVVVDVESHARGVRPG